MLYQVLQVACAGDAHVPYFVQALQKEWPVEVRYFTDLVKRVWGGESLNDAEERNLQKLGWFRTYYLWEWLIRIEKVFGKNYPRYAGAGEGFCDAACGYVPWLLAVIFAVIAM